MLADIWPSREAIAEVIGASVDAALFRETYASVFEGDEQWRAIPIPSGDRYAWDEASTYIANPPFFAGLTAEPAPLTDIVGARALAVLGDSVTTDHISPAGSIAAWSPAGAWLQEHGVAPVDFNSYGSRRGHHEVMMRGTFGNIRLRNRLVEGKEGPYTLHLPDGETTFIYDAAMRYRDEGVPLVLIAGKEYGSGSSRDWAAKGTTLLGIRAVIAESYERIHRSNLVGHGRAAAPVPARRERGDARPHRARVVHDRRDGGPRAAPGRDGRRPLRRGRHGADVPGDRPARRPDRGGLPAPGRHPAGGAAAARRGLIAERPPGRDPATRHEAPRPNGGPRFTVPRARGGESTREVGSHRLGRTVARAV